MSQRSHSSRPSRTIRLSSAYLLAALAFTAGILFGTMLTGTSSTPTEIQQVSADTGNKLAHALELEELVRKNPQDVDSLIHLGNVYYDVEKYQDAVTAYEKALAVKPDNPDVLTDLGTMYRALGQLDLALARYNKAITFNPKHQNARFNKCVVLLDMGRKEEAKAAWEALVAVIPNAVAPDGTPVSAKIKQLITQ